MTALVLGAGVYLLLGATTRLTPVERLPFAVLAGILFALYVAS